MRNNHNAARPALGSTGVIWLAMAALSAAAPAYATNYGYTVLNYGDKSFTAARGINNNGAVVGAYYDPSGNQNGFSETGGVVTTIDFPQAVNTGLRAINDAGTAVGNGDGQGFSESGGVFTAINDPAGTATRAVGINDAGEIVGTYRDGSGTWHGYTDVANTFTTIDPAGSTYTFATGVNNAGEVVGYFTDSQGNSHGFRYSNGVFTQVDVPGATFTGILGINDLGQTVGFYSVQDPALDVELPFIETNGVFSELNVPGMSTNTDATGINNSGVISGYNTLANGDVEGYIATPTAVPEPGAWGLLLVGLCGSGAALRRRRRSGACHPVSAG